MNERTIERLSEADVDLFTQANHTLVADAGLPDRVVRHTPAGGGPARRMTLRSAKKLARRQIRDARRAARGG
jgi:hypothetical protein